MDKCCALRMADDILNDSILKIAHHDDLVSEWKDAPLETPVDTFDLDLETPVDIFDLGEPEIFSRSELLDIYIEKAKEERSAKEELRNLLRYLLDEGEEIPERLSSWVHREHAGRNTPVKRGRRQLVIRNVGIVSAYMFLCWNVPEFSSEDAIEFIACRIKRDPETVRPIVRILRTRKGVDWKGMRELTLQETP